MLVVVDDAADQSFECVSTCKTNITRESKLLIVSFLVFVVVFVFVVVVVVVVVGKPRN